MSIPCSLLLALVVLRGGGEMISSGVRMLESGRGGCRVDLVQRVSRHAPVIYFLRAHGLTVGGGAFTFLFILVFICAVTGMLSWLTYRYVEKPALRLKARSRHATDPRVSPEPQPQASPT